MHTRGRITYNTLLDTAVSCAQEPEVQQVINLMRDDKVPADTTTYNTLIKRCIRTKDLAGALKLMNKMRSAGMPPDYITYSHVVLP
jgi:pentatricopeptide repeat protein